MSILADWQIIDYCRMQKMIDPYVVDQVRQDDAGNRVVSYGPSSFGYDVRLGQQALIYPDVLPPDEHLVSDPLNPPRPDLHYFQPVQEDTVHWDLPPYSYALTVSLECFTIPPNVTCVVIGKSTYARLGLVVNVTPLEAGWHGFVTIELGNLTGVPIRLYRGQGIMQCLFFRGMRPKKTYQGNYQGQQNKVVMPR